MPQTHSLKNAYRDMWEVFGKKKADCYNQRKFLPINRVGLTHFIRDAALLRMVLAVEPKTVLDIGCASGLQVFALAPYCEKVVGVDNRSELHRRVPPAKTGSGCRQRFFPSRHVPRSTLRKLRRRPLR